MWKQIAFKHKQKSKQSGFITLEIVVAMMIALGFVLVSMQTLVLAMMIKVQAQEEQRANQLIEEDIEDIQQQMAILTSDDLGSSGFDLIDNPDDVCSTANYDEGYAMALWNAFTNKDKDGNDISGTLPNPSFQEIPSIRLLSSTSNNNSKQLGLIRTHVNSDGTGSVSPHATLKIRYQVREWDGTDDTGFSGDVIAERYVEVIPDVALECP